MMKRTILLGSFLTLALAFPCFAGQAQGLVESIDPSTNTIMVKDPVSGSGQAVQVHPKVLEQIKIGSVVKATLPDGSDKADTIEVLAPR